MAHLGAHIDPTAARQLKDRSYVDDTVMGGSREEVDRMWGNRIDGKYTGTISRILEKGAMTVKFIAMSSSDDSWEEEQLGGKNLGVSYRIQSDEIFFALRPTYFADPPKAVMCPDSRHNWDQVTSRSWQEATGP